MIPQLLFYIKKRSEQHTPAAFVIAWIMEIPSLEERRTKQNTCIGQLSNFRCEEELFFYF